MCMYRYTYETVWDGIGYVCVCRLYRYIRLYGDPSNRLGPGQRAAEATLLHATPAHMARLALLLTAVARAAVGFTDGP